MGWGLLTEKLRHNGQFPVALADATYQRRRRAPEFNRHVRAKAKPRLMERANRVVFRERELRKVGRNHFAEFNVRLQRITITCYFNVIGFINKHFWSHCRHFFICFFGVVG